MAFNPQDTFPQMRSDSVSSFPFNVFVCPYFTPSASAYDKDLSIELHIFGSTVETGVRFSFYGVLPIVASSREGNQFVSSPAKEVAYTFASTVWSHLEYSDILSDFAGFEFTLRDRAGGDGFVVELAQTVGGLTYEINSYAFCNKEQEDA